MEGITGLKLIRIKIKYSGWQIVTDSRYLRQKSLLKIVVEMLSELK